MIEAKKDGILAPLDIFLMSMESADTMRLEGDRFTGLEHHVWLNEITGIVSKMPSKFGQLWQDMGPEAVERDLEIFDEFGIPIVPEADIETNGSWAEHAKKNQMVSSLEKMKPCYATLA